ncbi:bifunctional NAD(P)H-hydrate repair enzyme [Campylobacterota bacterium]|nr:bifunctional NAD(P)H-hydrate repair enzyme [Campylobacterota bacterium]
MIALYESTQHLDKQAVESFLMSEELLMEHAALAIKREIVKRFDTASVLIVCGSGNNGADGLALARLLALENGFEPAIYLPFGTSSWLGEKQLERARRLRIRETKGIEPCTVLIDALFGSGFNRKLDDHAEAIVKAMETLTAFKIACDVPSGVSQDGNFDTNAKMNLTVTMGAPKLALFNDRIKDRAGEIVIGDLGLPREAYMGHSDDFLLEMSDLALPFRRIHDSHKGSYGHFAVVMGDKPGAALLSAMAALRFGAGLATIISREHHIHLPYDLLQSTKPIAGTGAIAFGMGLGESFIDAELLEIAGDLPVVLDADAFSRPIVLDLLARAKPLVLTPHPKEFALLLSRCGFGKPTVADVQENRLKLTLEFSNAYPNVVLVLKGANVIIANGGRRFLNPHGSPVLAKGGSGDVLAGMIGSLIVQGYLPLEAAINASLAHTKAAQRYEDADFSMLPTDLIGLLGKLADD